MKRPNIKALCAAIAINLVVCAPAFAGTLDASSVPSKADVVGHIDVTALRSSALARNFSKEIAEAERELANTLKDSKIPLDARDILSATGMTFWAAGDDIEHGAMIVSGIDANKLQRAVASMPEHSQKNIGGASLHRFRVDGEQVHAGFAGNRLIVADDKKSIIETVKTITGKASSLAQSGKASRLAGSKGVFFMAAFGEAIAKKIRQQANSPIFDNVEIRRGTLTIGESGNKLVAVAVAETSDAKGANQLHKLAGGAMSFFAVASDDKKIGDILSAINIDSSGNTVTFKFAMPVADIIKLAKSI